MDRIETGTSQRLKMYFSTLLLIFYELRQAKVQVLKNKPGESLDYDC